MEATKRTRRPPRRRFQNPAQVVNNDKLPPRTPAAPPPPAEIVRHNVGSEEYSTMNGRMHPQLLQALKDLNFTHMSPVQARVLQDLPSYRSDCLVQAKTGTGKTIAFLLPVLDSILKGQVNVLPGKVSCLIISPTRELAQQIATESDRITARLGQQLTCQIAVGGTGRPRAAKMFMERTPKILVATPGRLGDYLDDPMLGPKFSNIQTLILDEADTMLESGFFADVKKILTKLPPKSQGWQGMCFSATMPPRVKQVVGAVLKPGYTHLSTIDPNEKPTHENIDQFHVIYPHLNSTFTVLRSLLETEKQHSSKIVVFALTARMVQLLATVFTSDRLGMPVFEIHSRLSQPARTRATEAFKKAEKGIMFASDVIGRGMDFPDIDLVVQVSFPSPSEQYVHRVGRTARAGKKGRAVIMLTEQEKFFLDHNKQFPIKPYPETQQVVANADRHAPDVMQAMRKLQEPITGRAYSSLVGYYAMSPALKQMGLDKASMVQMWNDFAINAMGCREIPGMEKSTIGKMGLRGVPGFRIVAPRRD